MRSKYAVRLIIGTSRQSELRKRDSHIAARLGNTLEGASENKFKLIETNKESLPNDLQV